MVAFALKRIRVVDITHQGEIGDPFQEMNAAFRQIGVAVPIFLNSVSHVDDQDSRPIEGGLYVGPRQVHIKMMVAKNGTNRQLVVMLRTHFDDPVSVDNDGKPTDVSRDPEQELMGFHDIVNVPSHGAAAVRATFATPGALVGTGRDRTYRLVVLAQPTVHGDRFSVDVRVPHGWSVDGPTTASGTLSGDVILDLHLHESAVAWLFDAVVARPFRLATGLIGRLF